MFNETTNAIAVKINNTYKEGMPDNALYDVTRTAWKIDKEKRSIIKYVVAVNNGIIKDVFKVAAWVNAGTTINNVISKDEIETPEARSEFVGNFADDEIRANYKGQPLTKYAEESYREFVYMTVND